MPMNVKLSPDFEKLAEECVAEGRFDAIDDVVDAALHLFQDQEMRRRAFIQSLKDAEEESEREGYVTLEEVMADMDAIIAAAEASEAVQAD
ncbi:transcriptional regulator [Caulobacter vibrioides]|nr:transcriptional regulator [Caulobacter vibrioides]